MPIGTRVVKTTIRKRILLDPTVKKNNAEYSRAYCIAVLSKERRWQSFGLLP